MAIAGMAADFGARTAQKHGHWTPKGRQLRRKMQNCGVPCYRIHHRTATPLLNSRVQLFFDCSAQNLQFLE